jgi:hypothetical protein
MKQRLGCRFGPSPKSDILINAALQMGVNHFDCCLGGEFAPSPAALARACEASGKAHNLTFEK